METHTKGNIIVEKIKVGDVHYEFDYGCFVKVKVITLPILNNKSWTWKSKHIKSGRIIDYCVTIGYSHYSVKLYDHMAYMGCKEI